MAAMGLGTLWYGQCLEVVGFVQVGLLPGAGTSWGMSTSSELLQSGGTCLWQGAQWTRWVASALSVLLFH